MGMDMGMEGILSKLLVLDRAMHLYMLMGQP